MEGSTQPQDTGDQGPGRGCASHIGGHCPPSFGRRTARYGYGKKLWYQWANKNLEIGSVPFSQAISTW